MPQAPSISSDAQPAPMEVKYTFVQSYNELRKVSAKLSKSSTLFLDCEGQTIGSPEGVLSLISVGTAGSEEIFVVDVLRLCDRTNPHLRRFLHFLERNDVTKVIWDGRMDYAEIFATFGVRLQEVLDLQVAEVMARKTAKEEREFQRRGRLRRMFKKEILQNFTLRPLMQDFNVISGLQAVIREQHIVDNLAKDDEVVTMHKKGNSAFWLKRPLPPKLVQYAATDIKLVSLTYDYFLQHRWVTAADFMTLIEQSMTYVSYFDSRERRLQADELGFNRLLPLDVMHTAEPKQYQCQLCLRMLNLYCFEGLTTAPAPAGQGKRKSRDTPNHSSGPQSHRRPCCRICTICAKEKDVVIPMDWVVV